MTRPASRTQLKKLERLASNKNLPVAWRKKVYKHLTSELNWYQAADIIKYYEEKISSQEREDQMNIHISTPKTETKKNRPSPPDHYSSTSLSFTQRQACVLSKLSSVDEKEEFLADMANAEESPFLSDRLNVLVNWEKHLEEEEKKKALSAPRLPIPPSPKVKLRALRTGAGLPRLNDITRREHITRNKQSTPEIVLPSLVVMPSQQPSVSSPISQNITLETEEKELSVRYLPIPLSKKVLKNYTPFVENPTDGIPRWNSDPKNQMQVGDRVVFCTGYGEPRIDTDGTAEIYLLVKEISDIPEKWRENWPDRQCFELEFYKEMTYKDFCTVISYGNTSSDKLPALFGGRAITVRTRR